jgi:hypothetical protein
VDNLQTLREIVLALETAARGEVVKQQTLSGKETSPVLA